MSSNQASPTLIPQADGSPSKAAGPRPATQGGKPRRKSPPRRSALVDHGLYSVSQKRFLARLRYQMGFGLLLAVVAPSIFYNIDDLTMTFRSPNSLSTAVGCAFAFIITLYLFRRVTSFPGVGMVGHVLPATTAAYGIVVAFFFALRLDYSRLTFFASFVAAMIFFFVVSTYLRRRKGQLFYIVPSPSMSQIANIPDVQWILLTEPKRPPDPNAVIIADLRADLGDEWERLIADMAVAGHPVYHVKQVQESITGRVEIEHLSENSFGSLVPNLSYRKVKRMADLVTALLCLPLLIVPGLIVALLIKLESPGPAFFTQKRRGYRGKVFQVVKFRTMADGQAAPAEAAKDHAITRTGDARITRLGRFLRRSRIDELPQILNIIKGDMSWIGPRPEALPLSDWYMTELPFYHYRHIVRPGITGWAQVNQGHVAELGEVHEKLHYDFYYVKNFSAWLDLLIVGRTVATVLSGFGAK